MATSNVLALRKSLESLQAEGIEARMARYRMLAVHLREGLRRIEMRPFTPDELLAPVLTAAYGPPGVPTGDTVAYMSTVHDTKIAGGLGEKLKDVIFRIGHMAPTTTLEDIDDLLSNLANFTPDWRSTFTEKAERD
jgi:aspartate aminotransferase-like enzyme